MLDRSFVVIFADHTQKKSFVQWYLPVHRGTSHRLGEGCGISMAMSYLFRDSFLVEVLFKLRDSLFFLQDCLVSTF